jgi:hypothetical protein
MRQPGQVSLARTVSKMGPCRSVSRLLRFLSQNFCAFSCALNDVFSGVDKRPVNAR